MRDFSPAVVICVLAAGAACAAPLIHVNQVAYDARGPKLAVIQTDAPLSGAGACTVIDEGSATQLTDTLGPAQALADWAAGKSYYQCDFSGLSKAGTYRVRAVLGAATVTSEPFRVEDNALAKLTLPWIVRYINKQRANTAGELQVDAAVRLWGSTKTVDVRGGWGDDAGNSSKYMSHLNYANFFSPQQIPMHAWELADAFDRIPDLVASVGMKDSLQAEALWGADYLYRILTPENYFYMVVFDSLSCTTSKRRVCGLLADSKEDDRWQCSFRAGGGMAIAALARIAQWKKNGADFTAQNYLEGAKRAFAHLQANNAKYLYDGKENIIDDYCALMAATELWVATDSGAFRDEARVRAQNLAGRVSPQGYFIADAGTRPFWSACDAGLPVLALVRYLDKESDGTRRATALGAIKKALDYELAVTNRVANPFGYARQNFALNGSVREGFFIPQKNETGWWWQGENARLGSLAAAALLGGRLVYPADNGWGVKDSLARFAMQQVAWVLGMNPFDVCFMYGFGKTFPGVTSACFGHKSTKGGISNGVTGKAGHDDGTGIDYNPAGGDEWRYTEQWIPHAIRMLAATAAMVQQAPVAARPVAPLKAAGPRASVGYADRKLIVKLADPWSADLPVVLLTADGREAGAWVLGKGKDSAALALPRLMSGVYRVKLGEQAYPLVVK